MSNVSSQQPTSRDKSSFTLYTARDFPSLPELEWLVEDIFPQSGLLSVYGPSGVGKSFLCLDLAAAVADGHDWFGHSTKMKEVVYISLEGQAGLRRRVAAWEKHNDALFPILVTFIFDQFHINDLEEAYRLGSQIAQDGGAGLIIIDTLNRASPGSDENSSADMSEILMGAAMLQKLTAGAVLLVHHPGKDVTRRLRGHSSLIAALDTVVELNEDGNVIRWKLIKSKDGENGVSHAFTLEPIEIGTSKSGKPVRSCVVQEIDGYVSQQQPSLPRGANQQAILEAVTNLLLEHRIQSFLTTPDWPDGFPAGLPYIDIQYKVKDTLETIAQKHRSLRTREAFERLLTKRYLVMQKDLICLPNSASTQIDI